MKIETERPVLEKIALTEKEVIKRYPFSLAWLRRARWEGTSPTFIKIGHRVFYPLTELDKWFFDHGLKTSTSQ
jgi:hypothetical protein